MSAATDLERIFQAFASPQFARESLLQLGVLAVSLGLAWLLARTLRTRLGEQQVRWKFGEGGFNRVIFPLAALAFTWVASLVMRRHAPVTFLDLGVILLIALAVIRAVVYVLRYVLPQGTFLRGSERTIAWTMWIGVALYVTGLLPEVAEALDAVSFTLAKQRISLLLILQAVVAVATTLAVSMWFARMIEGRVMANDAIEMSTRVVVSKFVRAIALAVAVLIALPLVGLDLTALTVFGGALGVGLGFGLQKIASNYVSGYIILLDRSIRIGDLVTVDNRHGEVREIAARYTVVRAGDGTESIIPNETLITQSVTNHSYTDRNTAVKVVVSVGYESDLDAAFAVLVEAARAHPRVLAEPAPSAAITRLVETGVEIELTAWIGDPEQGQGGLRSDVFRAALEGFRKRGVLVPPPPRDPRLFATPATQISSDASMA